MGIYSIPYNTYTFMAHNNRRSILNDNSPDIHTHILWEQRPENTFEWIY